MAVDIEHIDPSGADQASPPDMLKTGWPGLLVLPLALLVYLIAMPFFALFWIIEWLLPLHPAQAGNVWEDNPVPALRSRAEDSPSR